MAARITVVTGAALALLLVGAAVGLLITIPPGGRAEPRPSSVDIGFARDMSVHHQQAVTMATIARQQGHSAAVRQLAFDIDTNQRDQIGRMQGWLALWNEPVQSTDDPGEWMDVPGGRSHHRTAAAPARSGQMPGMAERQELSQLRALRGPEFDIYFLQLMLRHHVGGLPMAEHASLHASLPSVSALAASMVTAQSSESDLLTSMLADHEATPLPPS
nr:DUF305 domain-containing protein [Saccharopolyspora sp. HNM0983]